MERWLAGSSRVFNRFWWLWLFMIWQAKSISRELTAVLIITLFILAFAHFWYREGFGPAVVKVGGAAFVLVGLYFFALGI